MLNVSHLFFAYKRRPILQDISFSLQPGECLVLAGPNGSGKSTLLSLIAGSLKPGRGTIDKGGQTVGLVPQDNGIFPDMTVLENITFFSRLAHRQDTNRVASHTASYTASRAASHMASRIARPLPLGLEPYASYKAGSLSGGFQKRLAIAATSCANPDIWLFDEPATSLDMIWREEITAAVSHIKAQGYTVIYAAHDPSEFLSFYDAILFLNHGQGRLFHQSEIPKGSETSFIRQQILAASEPSER